jgi:hypothetical protein
MISARFLWLPALACAMALLLGTLGCSVRPFCLFLGPDEEQPNHVQPFEIGVDPATRRVFSTSLGSRTVAVIDADEGTIDRMLPAGSRPLSYPDIAVDEDGIAWVTARQIPPVLRYDLDSGERTETAAELARSATGIPAPGGGVLLLGFDGDGNQALVLIDGGGEVVTHRVLDRGAAWILPVDDEHVGLIRRFDDGSCCDDGFELLSLPALEVAAVCDLPFAAERGASLDDGTVVVADKHRVGVVGCDGQATSSWNVGSENKDVISLGAEAMVLDRTGIDEGWDPNGGVARIVAPDGVQEDRTFVSGKNTGYGAFDPITGLVWVNSEGTTEVRALDPVAGQVVTTVRTGTFLDGLTTDWEHAGVIYATGRLSNTLARIDNGELIVEHTGVAWPFSPQVEPARDRVWVISQLESTIHGHNRDDLASEVVIDTGLGTNRLLTFGSLAFHPSRKTLFFAHSGEDRLLEIQPDTQQILASWELGGPAIEDWKEIGELLVRVEATSGALIVCRSNDGRIQRIDPDGGAVQTVWLQGEDAAAVGEGNAVDFAMVLPKRELLYVGGLALDPATLDRLPDRDLDVHRVVGPHPNKDNQLLVVTHANELARVNENTGVVLGSLPFAAHDLHATVFRLDGENGAVAMIRAHDAYVCWFEVADLK